MKASTKKQQPGTIIGIGFKRKRYCSKRITAPCPNCAPVVIGFSRRRGVPAAQVRCDCCLVTMSTKLRVVPDHLLRNRRATRFLARHFSHQGNGGIRVRALTTVGPPTSSCRTLFRTTYHVNIPPKRLQRLFHLVILGILNKGISSRGGGFDFLVNSSKH